MERVQVDYLSREDLESFPSLASVLLFLRRAEENNSLVDYVKRSFEAFGVPFNRDAFLTRLRTGDAEASLLYDFLVKEYSTPDLS